MTQYHKCFYSLCERNVLFSARQKAIGDWERTQPSPRLRLRCISLTIRQQHAEWHGRIRVKWIFKRPKQSMRNFYSKIRKTTGIYGPHILFDVKKNEKRPAMESRCLIKPRTNQVRWNEKKATQWIRSCTDTKENTKKRQMEHRRTKEKGHRTKKDRWTKKAVGQKKTVERKKKATGRKKAVGQKRPLDKMRKKERDQRHKTKQTDWAMQTKQEAMPDFLWQRSRTRKTTSEGNEKNKTSGILALRGTIHPRKRGQAGLSSRDWRRTDSWSEHLHSIPWIYRGRRDKTNRYREYKTGTERQFNDNPINQSINDCWIDQSINQAKGAHLYRSVWKLPLSGDAIRRPFRCNDKFAGGLMKLSFK